jgi:ABC-type phosphate transport system substrate-binding protein
MTNQRRLKISARAAQGALVGALCLAAPAAHAADCSTLSKPVYVSGSSAVKPFLAVVAGALAAQTPPITVVYSGPGSCVGVGYFTNATVGTMSGTGTIWDTTGTEVPNGCTLDTVTGNTVDIGVSDVYASTCGSTVAAGVTDFKGPVQDMTFVVPALSTQRVISYEAAYLTFGLGAAGAVSPWIDPTKYEVRAATSGTLMMLATAISVPGAKWLGNKTSGSGAVVTAIGTTDNATASVAETAIGILGSDSADKNRDKLHILAYQAKGQSCGYLPDSTATSFDKQNVRDGHYMIWGPLHMFAKTSGGVVTNADAKTVIDLLTGAAVRSTFDLIKIEAKGGVTPDCAMRVTRTTEVGDLMSYMPPKSCECKFVAEATGTAPTSCKTCTADADCTTAGSPKCNFGYCEVQ